MTEPAIASTTSSPPIVPGSSSSSSSAPPARSGVITDGAYDGLPPDQQDRYARVKNGDSGGQWVARDQLCGRIRVEHSGGRRQAQIRRDGIHRTGVAGFSDGER